MPSNIFHFRQFTIQQDNCAMKVGTDGMLLGAHAEASTAERILDIGTGTGLLALMLAQKSKAIIDAVELDEEASKQAQENVTASPWSDRINVINQSIQEFSNFTNYKYDLIISNPPFFESPNISKGNNRQNTYSEARARARFINRLTHEDLLTVTKKLISPHGMLILILPAEVSDIFIKKALKAGFFAHSILYIRSKANLPVIRAIIEFCNVKTYTKENQFVIYNPDNSYTNQYIALTQDYHAKSLKKQSLEFK